MQELNQVDYKSLNNFLAAEQWKLADQETAKLMCQVANRVKEGWLTTKEIDRFPAEVLSTINQLWLEYSRGHFGFSIQQKIYQDIGGTKEYNEQIWEAFGDCVGWRKDGQWLAYSLLTFHLNVPQGYLPSSWCESVGVWVPLCYFLSSIKLSP